MTTTALSDNSDIDSTKELVVSTTEMMTNTDIMTTAALFDKTDTDLSNDVLVSTTDMMSRTRERTNTKDNTTNEAILHNAETNMTLNYTDNINMSEMTTKSDMFPTTELPSHMTHQGATHATNGIPGSRYDIEPSGYQLMQNATNHLAFVPRLDDDNTTLYCVATKAGRLQLVAVALKVTGPSKEQMPPDVVGVPPNSAKPTVEFKDESSTLDDVGWLVIAASCIGAILLVSVIIVMIVVYQQSNRGITLLGDDSVNGTVQDYRHNYCNPVFEPSEYE
ncbi:hypothetical protein LSAT2_006996 [Lamellibrachia satsuma]|nr:hypothetical protein LSAT2_006996 [Lamellibrachia satsuma]